MSYPEAGFKDGGQRRGSSLWQQETLLSPQGLSCQLSGLLKNQIGGSIAGCSVRGKQTAGKKKQHVLVSWKERERKVRVYSF